MPSRVTVREVAKLAHVHPSTVSRVFSGYASLREETRLRVLEAASRAGFVPNAAARTLATGVTKVVGLVIPDDVDPVYLQLAHSFVSVARERGYGLTIQLASYAKGGVLASAKLLLGGRVDGIVAFFMRRSAQEEEEFRSAMRRAGMAVVFHTDTYRQGDSVIVDYRGIYKLLFVALLRDGLRRIAAPLDPQGRDDDPRGEQAQLAWNAVQQEGQWEGAQLFMEGLPDQLDSARNWVRMLAQRWPGRFAIVADDSLHMATIVMALNAEGILFPGRVTLAGGLHPAYACYIRDPRLWCIDWATEEFARACFDRLIASIERRQPAADASVIIRPRIRRTDWRERGEE